ncbi:hypothetical protein BD770DRAFT_393630 [Pilaira anomala]|nr:hypothetical protein BD770DRAFT_393630 [Pilaira anomala]
MSGYNSSISSLKTLKFVLKALLYMIIEVLSITCCSSSRLLYLTILVIFLELVNLALHVHHNKMKKF